MTETTTQTDDTHPPGNGDPLDQERVGPFCAVLAALQFLTILPPLVRRPFTLRELARSVGYFPLVGLLLGGALGGLDAVLGLAIPDRVTVVLVLAAWIVATGGLHFDGLLDACDGLFGGRSPEERLRIMRDEHVGAFAMAGGLLLLLAMYGALVSMTGRLSALIVAPVLGRWVMALAVVTFPYARAEGLGRAMKDRANWRQGVLASVVALAVGGGVGRWDVLVPASASLLVGLCAAFVAQRRINGLTGDIYGSICVLVEATALIGFSCQSMA